MSKKRTVIGIDPDVAKNGVGVIQKKDSKFSIELYSLTLPELVDFLVNKNKEVDGNLKVYVEASYKIGSVSWHINYKEGTRRAHAMGVNVGQNQQVSKTIIEFCIHHKIKVEAIFPLKKTWKGPTGKITAEEFNKLTGWTKRSNQEERDAGLIACIYSNIPLRLKS